MIVVDSLKKEFTAKKKTGRSGLFATYEAVTVPAVKDISFTIEAGERVAFIGPNGAGKSTTLKMLSGILHPTSGHATVAGFVPWEDRQKLAYKIGLVFGQRSQLWYHLPLRKSYELLGKIYGLEKDDHIRQMQKLEATFRLTKLLDQPVKALSLGQRMRAEIAASLLHDPKILFLDEPTIGLDVTAKAELRDHLRTLSHESGTTLILTSHDTADIEEICGRVILINHGEKLIDASLADMRRDYLRKKQISFVTGEETPVLDIPEALSMQQEAYRLTLEIDPEKTPVADVITRALKSLTIHDIAVNNVPLEEVIKHIYTEARR